MKGKVISLWIPVVFCAIMLTINPRQASANVSLKNGNFFIAYTDAAYSGGFEPKIKRVYNSKTAFKGIFGWGWGNEFEVYLTTNPDGSVTIHEYGGGAENRFTPESVKQDLLEGALLTIVNSAVQTGDLKPEETPAYKTKLVSDPDFREQEWLKYLKKDLISPLDLPVGTILRSNKFGYQTVKRIRDGYVRRLDAGRSETFDIDGRLIRIADKNDNFIDIIYDGKRQFKVFTDNYGRSFQFAFNKLGLVEKIIDERNRESVYSYSDKGDLISSKDVDGNWCGYEYDSRHNINAIRYGDNTSMEMSYHGMDKYENIRSVKDRDGSKTTYDYYYDPDDKHHYRVTVSQALSDGSILSKSLYEYYERIEDSGSIWMSKMITDIDGDRTETEYNKAGLPVVIVRGDEATRFEYDGKGHVTRKETQESVVELRYQEIVGKVEYVKTYQKDDPKQYTESKFQYDDSGNLVYAENSDGIKLKLVYDNNGRISDIISGEEHLEFVYNRNSKPVEIKLVGVGKITVTYGVDGEIQKVDSDEGRNIALTVTGTFQRLLDVIRPAGVSLSF